MGVAGFATPGMRVDVLISGLPPSTPSNQAQIQAMGTLSETLLQNIEVLWPDRIFKRTRKAKPHPVQVVNLLVTPDQAET